MSLNSGSSTRSPFKPYPLSVASSTAKATQARLVVSLSSRDEPARYPMLETVYGFLTGCVQRHREHGRPETGVRGGPFWDRYRRPRSPLSGGRGTLCHEDRQMESTLFTFLDTYCSAGLEVPYGQWPSSLKGNLRTSQSLYRLDRHPRYRAHAIVHRQSTIISAAYFASPERPHEDLVSIGG